MRSLNIYLNESIFDVDDNINDIDKVTEIGNFYKLHWYEIRSDHDFAYFFKKSDITKISQQQGYFNADWFGLALKSIKGSYMTKSKNTYMLPLCNIIGHLQYSNNMNDVKKNIEEFVKKYERGLINVDVEERKYGVDTALYINLRRVTDDGNKKITICFKKNK